MPYDYRGMTPEERTEAVRRRWELGYPTHAPPHPYRGAGWYLLTAANFEHAEIMAMPDRLAGFEARLLDALQGAGARVLAWVVLPNHYHVLVEADSLDGVSSVLQRLHGSTSRQWNLEDGQTGTRRVWYKYTDRKLHNEAHFYRALNYIHINPVKHGCVEDPYEWPWSSLHSYRDALGREWLRDQWKAYPPGDFGGDLGNHGVV